jgi:hypothetical protein
MKIYLSQSPPSDSSLTHFGNIAHLSNGVMDTEATEITSHGFLSSFEYDNIPRVAQIIKSKARIGCIITIIEPDFYLISKKVFRQEMNLEDVNLNVFMSGSIKSMLTFEHAEQFFVNESFQIVSKSFDDNLCRFILQIRRNK